MIDKKKLEFGKPYLVKINGQLLNVRFQRYDHSDSSIMVRAKFVLGMTCCILIGLDELEIIRELNDDTFVLSVARSWNDLKL